MKTIEITLEKQNYTVFIGDVIDQLLQVLNRKKNVLIITDETVATLYLNDLKKRLADYTVFVYNMGNAEEHKNLVSYERCIQYALENYLDRDLQVIAFGGGAVGDFAGFFASTYKRGVLFVNVPTTLLAHDSAVGGKVAVNVSGVKNAVGTFYQPIAVIYHTPYLKSLIFEEIKSGFGEVFKHDLLQDGSIINQLMNTKFNLEDLIQDEQAIEDIIYRCILVKKRFIQNDIEDKLGIRQALNLGHTLAHAIELYNQLSHGEAVAFGLCFDLFLSNLLEYEAFYKLFKKLGFFNQKLQFNDDLIINAMKNDKKNKAGLVTFIGLQTIGKPYEIHLSEEEIRLQLTEFMNKIEKW